MMHADDERFCDPFALALFSGTSTPGDQRFICVSRNSLSNYAYHRVIIRNLSRPLAIPRHVIASHPPTFCDRLESGFCARQLLPGRSAFSGRLETRRAYEIKFQKSLYRKRNKSENHFTRALCRYMHRYRLYLTVCVRMTASGGYNENPKFRY
jgi:hypothetical protein